MVIGALPRVTARGRNRTYTSDRFRPKAVVQGVDLRADERLVTEADNCGFSQKRYLSLGVDAEREIHENIGQLAKVYPAARADYW